MFFYFFKLINLFILDGNQSALSAAEMISLLRPVFLAAYWDYFYFYDYYLFIALKEEGRPTAEHFIVS